MPKDTFPFERPGESLYAKESREADAVLAKRRATRKASKCGSHPHNPTCNGTYPEMTIIQGKRVLLERAASKPTVCMVSKT